ncbi:MAG: translation initiation factor, aIF-2BI family [Actinomycetia bacterium]|nr:translation initiation factor, aIF-2BI family [Actinomycetes bacterium]
MGAHGASWIASRISRRPLRVLTHCNAGALATCGWGTALGVVRTLFARDLLSRVYVNETRPLLQGSRLTAYELAHYGIAYVVQADVAAASTILRGLVGVAIIGADRIAASGDTANKIGSLGVALACADAGIPFVVAAPWSTIDLAARTGADISIEQRSGEEVLACGGVRTSPASAEAFNPAFDVTPTRADHRPRHRDRHPGDLLRPDPSLTKMGHRGDSREAGSRFEIQPLTCTYVGVPRFELGNLRSPRPAP